MKKTPCVSARRWNKLTLVEQMANIGSEVFRAISWKKKGNREYSKLAFYRSLELFDLTLASKKNRERLKEVARAREAWADYFAGDNIYQGTAQAWEKYFYEFNYLARLNR